MMFLFYGIAFYFFSNFILVIAIVIVCFKKNGHQRRDEYQTKKLPDDKNDDNGHISI
ncbi:putative membrane protein [Citrobacter rodentium ICC168]|uniref:Membrane protein n=1 Tax=Citrobacter rodentium (strain ICC168) TaxID=637910 RepID=D2TJJ7_CITRI|nr:putative membrane protein [Citrobacter rodentium ICC168]